MSITIYGIPNCDTVKKSRDWFSEHGLDYTFIDFKKTPPSEAQVLSWLKSVDWTVLLNRKGTTWRALDDAVKASVVDAASAAKVMVMSPSTIKRPVVDWNGAITVGKLTEEWQAML